MSDTDDKKMKDTSSSFNNLMSLLHSEFERIQSSSDNKPDRRNLVDILADGISKSLKEIRSGGSAAEFKDSAIIHTIVDGEKEGYNTEELRNFVALLKEKNTDAPEDDQ